MKAQLNLFNESATGIVNGSATLHKTVLKERIKNTHFQASNPTFTIEKWQAGDEWLPIHYAIVNTAVGELLIAATSKGVTYIGFIIKVRAVTIADLKRRFPENILLEGNNEWLTIAIDRVNDPEKELPLHLHLKGTEFQLGVWEKLLLIPFGGVTNYKQLGNGEADSRAIGSAVGANPVSYLVPCHRVIRADGNFDGFYWGREVKAHLLSYEATSIVK